MLRAMSQIELAALMAADGLNLHDLGKIERGQRRMTRAHQDSIQRHLRLPEHWFSANAVDEIVGLDD